MEPNNCTGCDRVDRLESRIAVCEARTAAHDTNYAVINTKLNLLLWIVGAIGTALIGVLVKYVIPI